MELRRKFAIAPPIIKTLMDHADMDLLAYAFGKIIGDQEMSFKEIAHIINERYGYKESWTRKQLALLASKGLVQKRRLGREDLYSMIASELSHPAAK
jgi:repressor of nif and glnA expression